MRWTLALFLLILPSAKAEEQAYQTAFAEGRYHEAVNLVQDLSSADGLAFAARSLLAEAMSADDFVPPPDLIETAEGKARAALALDPTHIEGRLQLAIALSLKARALSNGAAMRAGYGDETKSLAKAVLEDDPDNKYANGFLAVWHLEARRRGGAIGASMLGASVKKARHHYSKAISTAPGDASIHWQYARALTALNAKKYRQEIDAALDAAMGCSTESQLERIMQDRAQILQSTLIEQKRSQAEEIAARML